MGKLARARFEQMLKEQFPDEALRSFVRPRLEEFYAPDEMPDSLVHDGDRERWVAERDARRWLETGKVNLSLRMSSLGLTADQIQKSLTKLETQNSSGRGKLQPRKRGKRRSKAAKALDYLMSTRSRAIGAPARYPREQLAALLTELGSRRRTAELMRSLAITHLQLKIRHSDRAGLANLKKALRREEARRKEGHKPPQ